MNPVLIRKLFALMVAVAAVTNVKAHSVWMEIPESGDGLVARFGEFDDSYEETPGYLDSLDPLKIYAETGEENPTRVDFTQMKNGYGLGKLAHRTVIIQTGFPVMARGGGPAVRPYFYARWIPDPKQAASPKMNLDIVPTGEAGEFRVFFRGNPLSGVTVMVYTPEANDLELTTDENGGIRFQSDEKGLFMMKVGRHREERSGFERGVAYDKESHNCSVTWVQK